MNCIVVLIPPLVVIGEAESGFGKSKDDILGTGDAVLKAPALMAWTPGNINYQAFGKELHFPQPSPWPWRPAEKDEQEGYTRLKAASAGLVLAGAGDVSPGIGARRTH